MDASCLLYDFLYGDCQTYQFIRLKLKLTFRYYNPYVCNACPVKRDVNDSNRDETFFFKLCVHRALTVCVSARVCCQIKWNESLLKHFNDTKDTERRSGTKTKQIYM